MEEPFTKKKIDVTHKSGFISSIDVSIDMSWKQAGFNKQYLLTDFALVLLAIDDRWKVSDRYEKNSRNRLQC